MVPGPFEVRGDLRLAPDVAGDDRMRARRDDRRGFRCAECAGDRRLLQIVKARRSAADLAVWHLAERQSFHRAEQTTWRGAHALCVRQMAGIVICRDERLGQTKRRDESHLIEQL